MSHYKTTSSSMGSSSNQLTLVLVTQTLPTSEIHSPRPRESLYSNQQQIQYTNTVYNVNEIYSALQLRNRNKKPSPKWHCGTTMYY